MAQDNIKNLYDALKGDYDLGSEDDFRNSLKDANNRRNLYNAIEGDYDLGSEEDFEKSLGYGNEANKPNEPNTVTNTQQSFTQEEYGRLSPTAQEVAQGVGVAPNNGPNKPNEPNKADLQRVQEGMQRVQAREPKAQFVPEASNIVMATPTAETLKRYPWLKADEAVPFNRETGEPLYTWTDEQGKPISRSEIGIRTAKQEITGEREYMQQQPASLELPDSNARAMRLDGSLTEYVDVLMKGKYGDDYLNGTFTTADGRQVSGSELMTETAQQQYNELNNDINNARIEYLDADEGQRKELVDALSKKYQGLLTRESIERTMNDEQAQIEARETQRQRERQQIDEAYNKAYTDRAAVMQENARKAKEEYENSSWLDRMFGGNPVQRAYWMNQNDKRIQIADTQINIALDARRVLDTGKAYDEGESWSGRLVRGMRDAMTDTGLYDGGVEEMHDLRNVKEAVDAYEAGTATDAQKDLLDTYSLLTMVNGENADALGGMYGAGQMTIQAIPFMAQMYINPIGSLGQSTMKAATRFGVRTFGRSMMNQYMKRLLTTSLKAGGRVTGDMLAAALPAMTFGAPAIGADMYDRLIGNVRGTRNEQGNVEYIGRDNAETSKAAAIAKSIGSNYLEYQSEMVGEYFRPLSNIISSGIGRATDKLGLGKVRDMIANISNKDFYRAYADFARRTQWQGTFNEYLEEVVNNVENAQFIGDMDFSTDENGVFNLDTNIDTFLGVAVMSGFMSSLKTVDYIRTKGRLKDALDNAYTSGLDVFGTKEWQRITNEIDGLDDKTAASAVKKMLNNVDSDEKKRTIINYATAALANQGFNAGELKNSLEQVSDAAVNGGVPQDAIPRIENLAPEERQNVHVDGMIHAAVLYPTAENNGQPQEVFITRGNVVMREDGTIDTEASDKEIYYKGVDGQVHIVSPDKLQAVAEPISVEDYVAANRPNEANEPDMAEEIVPGQVVNINVDGQTYQATVQGTDGNGNVSVYYQDANGMDRPATFTIDEIRNANRPNNEEPPVGGAGAVVENAEPNGTNEPNASQTAEDRMPIDVSEYFGNAEEAMATAKDIIQNGEVIGTLPDGSVQMQNDGFVATLMPDGNGGMNVTGIERTGNNAPQNIPENGNIGAKNIQQTDGISTENGGISAENIQQEQQIPQDDEGNLIYDQVPVEATIADLYDGSLNDDEVQGFIDANINEAQKKYDSVQKKAPKIGTNKAKYLEQKRKWQADVDEAKRVLDYWNEVNSQKQALTHTTEEETQAAQAELSGQNAREEFNQYNENGVNDAVSVASDFIRGAKITPESFRAETGYGTGEQRRFVGMIASEQNGGKSIDRLAEELVSYDNAELNGVTFNGDTSAAKDAILEALQSAGTRGELTTDNTAEQERYVEARRAELDAQCMEAYGMTYEDYLAYEEQNLPEMLRKYANFDEVEFYNLYADEIEQSLNARINEQGNDTAGEEPRTGGGNEVLPEQGIGNAGGSEGGTEQGTEVPAGVQGTVEDGAVPEETNRGEDKEYQLSETDTQSEQVKQDNIRTIDPRSMSNDERQQRGDMLRNAPAIEVKAGQIVSTPELSARKVAERWWDENVPEPVFYDTEVGEVEINKNSVESSLAHRYGQAKLDAITSLVDGFENAVYLGTLPDFTRQEGVLSHYFAYPIIYNDKRCYVFCRAMQDANKNRLYVHEVFVAENIKRGDTLQTAASQPHGGIALYKDILGNVLEEAPEQQSLLDGNNPHQYPANRELSESKDTQTSANEQTVGEKIAQEEAKVEQNPTEAQKEAGNYKKGHVRIGQFNITVENPKGSMRRGTDANGNPWETTMQNTYGYIRGTEGVDGDHIDVFLTNDIDGWNGRRVYVVDQYNEDGTFDEHKVMLGFNDEDDARNAYFANYSDDWADKRKIVMTSTNLEDFEKWIDSSHRKTKPFAEYKNVKNESVSGSFNEFVRDSGDEIIPDGVTRLDIIRFAERVIEGFPSHTESYDTYNAERTDVEIPSGRLFKSERDWFSAKNGDVIVVYDLQNKSSYELVGHKDAQGYLKSVSVIKYYGFDHKKTGLSVSKTPDTVFEITPAQYTTKRGKVLDMFLVTFAEPLSKERQWAARELAKTEKGWYDRDKEGFMMRSEESARKLVDRITGNEEAVIDAQPLSLADTRKLEEPVMRQVDLEGLMQAIQENGEAKLSDHLVPQSEQKEEASVQESESSEQKEGNAYGANNKLVSRDRYEELKVRMRQKLGGQMNMGIDPEILAIGTEMAAYHIEAGARKFADYARHMIADLGDAIRPYLKSFYNGARDLPEVQEAGLADEMTPYDEVRTFDTANFDKPTVDAIETAHTVVQEQEVNKQAEEAKNILTTQRNEKERQKRSRNKKKSVSSQQTPDLFGNVNAEQNQEDDNYGLQRNDGAVRAEGLPTDRGDTEEPSGSMGETVGQESGRPDRSGEESGSGELRRSLQQSERLDGQLTPRNRNNNHVERGTDYAPTTPKARYDANVEAVRLAKELTDSGQQATDEQKAILRQFSGWGGLGTFFNNERTRNELVALLGDDGYQQAAMSINSAYYTPADVIDAMWDIVKNLGFKGGNILEGSAGIGNILGLMPMDISDRSNIEAVEIDGVSGMILKLLYPDAKVDIQGFENTQVRNGSVDLAITNVPFVTGLHVHDTTGDRDLSRRFGNIHDFCIAKNVRKLREGGIGVFISSSGTLDKNKALREWVVNEGNADFIGAFRLNNKTFGGTTATSDIIVVRKRVNGNKSAGAIDLLDTESVRTVSVPINDNGREKIKSVVLQYNKYFVEHPENMGGEMALNYERGETFRPEGSGLFPTTGINQEERMQQWAETFKDKAVDVPQPQTEEPADTQTDTNGNEIKDGTIVVGEDGSINVMYLGRQEPLGVNDKKVKGHTKAECVEDYNRIKRALNAVLEYETTNEKDDGLKPLLKELNDAYDSFKDKYGNLNKNTAISFLRNDIDFPSIQALEKFNETNDKDGKRIVQTEKTSIFTERVVQKEVEPHPTNVLDAVKTSVFRSGRIDLDYISNALGRDVSDIEKEIIDNGLGYRDPATGNMEVSYEYLSGNVRQKLAIAEANNEDGRYDKNIKALRKVMPMDIPAHLIEFTFGSSWVNPKLFSDYVNEKTGVPVTLTNVGGQWNMDLPYYTATEKNKSEGVRSEKLNKIVLGTDLMNAAINNRTITVSTTQRTWDGKTETITDKEATQACAAKIDDIRNDFKDWARAKMQSDPEMAKEIERAYNDRFNNYVPVQVPDEFTSGHFPGASTKITLFPHQSKAVIRATGQPIMLAHEVGTGKTFTLITTAMEMRRLGLARKPMIVVQNATVGQFIASAKELYPNAKVLTIADNERNEEGRKRFYAKIKYNDWDMIVVPQSVFERIPDSEERQMDFINDRIEEKEHVLEQIQEIDPKSMIARNAKRELDSLQTELAEVSDKKRQKDEKRAAKTRQNAAAKAQEQLDRATDDVENFDDMEIDAVLVDEAHEYKHLGFSTAMQRGVKGVDPSYSKKSAGVYLKTRAVMDRSGGKNVIFATGTPISNTAAEIWTFMRYLMPKHMMEEYGIYYFDDFVRNFGNLTQMLEFTTSGKFRENNRFAGYVNIPELIRIWSSVSDTVLTKETNLKDKLPETVDGGQKATDIYLPQSASLRSIMKAVRAELERFDNMSGKEKKENSAIPLVMYGIAKAAAIDPRLVMAAAADEPVSKTNRAVEETLKSLEATKDYKGTVAIFCDTYQNNQTGFNIYEEIKRKLVERGVPENQIVIMRSGMSVNKKAEIFDKVNAGDVRVIMGSTFTLGTGVNIQERLNTLIHLDAPNRPMDYTQRNGRILRQGNLHKQWGLPVKILRFGVEDSLDITAYQRLKTKGAIADSVMEGKKFINNNQQDRTLEEQEDVFGDTVAQLSGSEYALLKNQAERDFRKYSNKKKQYETDQIYVHNAIPRYEGQIKASEETVKQQQKALSAVEKAFPDGTVQEITIGNSKLSGQKEIGDYIKDVVNKKQTETEDNVRKGAQGTKASSSFTIKAGPFTFTVNTEYSKDTEFQNGSLFPIVHRNMTYSCDELGLSNVPVQRASFKNAVDDIMNNVLSGNDMRERIETENNSIERNRSELEQLKSREGKPFENEKELEDARKKVEEYTEKMRKEMAAKEQKYAEMDAQTQIADLGSLSGAEEAEEDGETLYREADGYNGNISVSEEEANDLFRVVDDASEIERLNSEPTVKVYRAMSLVDGKLYPPMSKKIGTGSNRVSQAPSEFGQWEVSDERPEFVEKEGAHKNHIYIVKDNGKGLWVAYNPYFHTSRNPLNDQFAEAYQRPNLVTVEVEVPESELTSGYQAEGAKDPVGETKWNAGPVNRQLSGDKKRKVILSRWMRPVRIVPDSEVAQHIAELIEGEDVAIPVNTVTPSLLEELKKLGVKIVDGISKGRKKASAMMRGGSGALTDDELSLVNDPAAALTGRSTRTSAQRRRFAERERQRMVDAVQKLARKLNLDNVDIVTDASTLQGRRSRAKGFYSRSTGRITIVIPNHMDIRDVEQTLLHEAVAHYGLRQLFGEHFDTFLDNVYNNVDPELKQRIDAMSQQRGWSTRTATEEYLASLAENTNFEDMNASWWDKIKRYFLRMLHEIGFEGFKSFEYISDNELRYLLWRSYENLAEPGRYRSIMGEVRDIAKQHELNVGNYSSSTDVTAMSAENDVRFREEDEAEEDLSREWQDEYDRRTLSAVFKFTEAAQDGMKSVSILQDVISKETDKPIKEDENVWALQNRLSSTNKYEQDYFYENYYKPLMMAVGNLVKAGARYNELGRNMEDAQDDILKYLISKHGIERNAHFREVAAMEARRPYEESIEEIRKAVDNGEITQVNADKQIDKLTEQANEAEEKSRIDTITRDYSGLSELYNNKMDFDALAEQYVLDFESKFDTADLWNKINAATKTTLRKTYEAGLISRSGYEVTRDMYQYYIPLRGWSNDVASEMYNYKGQQGVGGRIMKRAKGRKSLAENPLAVIGRMGQDGILQANKNRVKQRLYNLAIGHDTSLLSISKQWYVNEGTKENPDWQRAYPELSGDMGADEVAAALKEFDEKMKALKDEGMATQRRDGLTLKYHTTTAQEQQHRVNVSIGGREYNIYVNGNPRAAQAINGELRMDDEGNSIIQRVNRWLANVYTSLNPEFVVTNYERDAGFAAAIVAATETPAYQAGWIKNMAKFNPLTTGIYINHLISKSTKGQINPDNTTERYMQEFLANGGETGFTNMLTADDYKKLIKKEIKEVNKPITASKAVCVCFGWAQRANRVFEDATRFATYVTSREQGRSIDRSIRDAKEISLNFNTRGADGMKNDGVVHKLFRNLRRWIIFTNPSIQGLNKAGVAFSNHPVRSTLVIAGLPAVLGYGVAALAASILDGDDDEKVREAYMDLPKWIRRTNICIPIEGTKFVTIPLSYELRVSYGLGEMFWEIEQGMIEPGELVKETVTQLSDLLPLSFASGTVAQNLSPTIVRPLVDIIQNKDFTGRPIYRENTFNQGMPEYTKAYAGTAKWLTKSSEVLNNATPKFWVKDYPEPDKYTPGAININPAIVEHLLDSYLGGLYTFPSKAAKTVSMIWDEDMQDIRNIPFLNRNVKDSQSGNPITKSAGDRYNTYMKEYRLSKQRWDGYRREANHGVTEFVPKLIDFTNSVQGQRMFIIDGYKKSLDELDKQVKDMGEYEGYGEDEERKRLKQLSNDLKQELVDKLDSVSMRR